MSKSTPEDDISNRLSHIDNGIYLSGLTPLCSNNIDKNVQENNIQVIISMTECAIPSIADYCIHNDLQYHHFPTDDASSFDISQYFDATYDIIYNAVKNKKHVLVHCMAGISRSATIVIAFLIRFTKDSYVCDENYAPYLICHKMLKLAKEKRVIVQPNNGFIGQLMNLEDSFGFIYN